MSARGVLAVFCVCLVGCLAELDTAEKDTEWNGDVDADATDGTGTGVSRDCEGHCSLTYPEHTYPRPFDHSACRRGCRLAKIESLIAWPISPPSDSCTNACKEAYPTSSSSEQYACLVGCNATTLDSLLANARPSGNTWGSVWSILHLFESTSDRDLDTLNQHAEILLPLTKTSSVMFVTQSEDGEEVVSYTSYSIGDGNLQCLPPSLPTTAPVSIDLSFNYDSGSDMAASNINSVDTQNYLEEDADGDHADLPYHFHCRWKGQSVFARLLMAFCLGFVIFAFFTCCFAICGTTKEEMREETHSKKLPKPQHHLEHTVVPGEVKVPLELSTEFVPYQLPVMLSSGKRVEGILSVV